MNVNCHNGLRNLQEAACKIKAKVARLPYQEYFVMQVPQAEKIAKTLDGAAEMISAGIAEIEGEIVAMKDQEGCQEEFFTVLDNRQKLWTMIGASSQEEAEKILGDLVKKRDNKPDINAIIDRYYYLYEEWLDEIDVAADCISLEMARIEREMAGIGLGIGKLHSEYCKRVKR